MKYDAHTVASSQFPVIVAIISLIVSFMVLVCRFYLPGNRQCDGTGQHDGFIVFSCLSIELIDFKVLLEHQFLLADGRDCEQFGSLASTLCTR